MHLFNLFSPANKCAGGTDWKISLLQNTGYSISGILIFPLLPRCVQNVVRKIAVAPIELAVSHFFRKFIFFVSENLMDLPEEKLCHNWQPHQQRARSSGRSWNWPCSCLSCYTFHFLPSYFLFVNFLRLSVKFFIQQVLCEQANNIHRRKIARVVHLRNEFLYELLKFHLP